MVFGVTSLESHVAIHHGFVRMIVMVRVVMVVTDGVTQVTVVEVQPPRFHVMIRGFMHVGRAGHGAERQQEGTAAQHEGLPHR